MSAGGVSVAIDLFVYANLLLRQSIEPCELAGDVRKN